MEVRIMSVRRPFRFGVICEQMTTRRAWIDQARRAEEIGYATLLIRDHLVSDFFGEQFAPFSALMAAAAATTTLRVGTLVIDNDFRHPVVLAKEAATLDVLSDGRFELGLGAGWLRAEYDKSGIPFQAPATRIARLEEAIRVLKRLFAETPASFSGEHYALTVLDGYPKPAQRPHPPILIGGAGKRMLALAAREADIIHFLPSAIATGTLVANPLDRLSATLLERIAWVREQAGTRFDRIELAPSTIVVIADDRQAAIERLIEENGWREHGIGVEQIRDMPGVFVGTVDEIATAMIERRDRFGFSYIVVPSAEMELCAPIVARLAGT
jgi:probable F420-dependent oxidoreductase